MNTAIDIAGVHKHYDNLSALDGIDLTIQRGEFFGLLGPNGAGKSTLINIIAGLTRANQGKVSVLGHDVVDDYRNARRRLGIVPQELVFDAFFTVREVLQIQSGYFGLGNENNKWIDNLMDALKLTDKANTNMRALSGGMKRRVLIAQALVHKPDVVVLDEPTAGVDVELRKLLWTFVRGLHQDGHTIVLTTHYLEEAESLCERIAILNHGKVVALDTKQGLLNSEICRKILVSITAVEPISVLPDAIRDKVKVWEERYIEIEMDKDTDSIGGILDSLREAGIEIADMQTTRADLEDVFLDITYGHAS
jgi:ABC-2 type transport system ATP-binding protein